VTNIMKKLLTIVNNCLTLQGSIYLWIEYGEF